MKLILFIAVVLGLCGCTTTEITTGQWSMKRRSFLQRMDISEVRISTNGTATLTGYRSDGGNDAVAAVTAAAVSAAVNSIK